MVGTYSFSFALAMPQVIERLLATLRIAPRLPFIKPEFCVIRLPVAYFRVPRYNKRRILIPAVALIGKYENQSAAGGPFRFRALVKRRCHHNFGGWNTDAILVLIG
jgi:hypothetical protein